MKVVLSIIMVFTFFSCSSNNRGSNPYQIIFMSMQINDGAISSFGASMLERFPEMTIEGRAPLFSPMRMGETIQGADPMMAMGLSMRLAAQMTGGEINMIISNMENADSMAQAGNFVPLAEILTGNELSALNDRALTFEIMRIEGTDAVPTGERTAAVGLDVSDNEQIRAIFGDQQIGVFIVVNTSNMELSKTIVRSLL